MKLPYSSYYYRCRAESSEAKGHKADLTDRIETICLEFPRYGYRRVTAQLKREKFLVNHKRVLRLMRESDLLCRVKRRWTRTTDFETKQMGLESKKDSIKRIPGRR